MRKRTLAPHIESRPDVHGGLPVVAGTRIDPDSLAAFWAPGGDVSAVLAEYPGVGREQAIAAIAWEMGRRYERVSEGHRELRERLLEAAEDYVAALRGLLEVDGD